MPRSIVLYYELGQYQPSMRWYLDGVSSPQQSEAESLATVLAAMISDQADFVAWEGFNAAGDKVSEGVLSEPGTFGDEPLPPKYCALWRLISEVPVGRPSVKFVHFLSEGMMTDGVPTAGYLAALAASANDLVGLGVTDSDGSNISDIAFRSFTRRKKVRRKP